MLKKTMLTAISLVMAIGFSGVAQGALLWSADFEEPDYVDGVLAAGAGATGQQGWWMYNAGWTAGYVLTSAGSKMAQIGGSNYYAQRILSPWVTNETASDTIFEVSMTIRPGGGSQAGLFGIYDNSQACAAWIDFASNGNIQVRGGGASVYTDTGFAYTGGTTYELDIIWDDANELFSVMVDGNYIAQDVATGGNYSGFGYMYINAGGNNGTPLSGSYTFLDNMSITGVPEPMTLSLIGLGAFAMIRRRRA